MKYKHYKYSGMIMSFAGAIWFFIMHNGITQQYYIRSIKATKELPVGDTVSRTQAAIALRMMSIDNASYARQQLYPVLLMMIGFSFQLAAQRKWPNKSKHPTANRSRDAEITHE